MRFPRRWLLLITAALSLAVGLDGVGADYIGPNRTTTTTVYERDRCAYQAVYDPPGSGWYGCSLVRYAAPASCPSTGSVVGYFTPDDCLGWPGSCSSLPCSISLSASREGCSAGEPGCTAVQRTVSLPPATVGGSFGCSLPGNNGWCRGGGALNLSASEPLGGYVITDIEGGPGLLCDPPDAASASCSWTGGGEGNYTIAFWAHSSYGDTSSQASATWRQDTVAPTGSVAVSGGTAGSGGWMRGGPLTIGASGSDATSGFAGGQISVAGGPWGPSALISADGVYDVAVQPVDVAGNDGSGTGIVRLDNTPPTLTTTVTGTQGGAGWYVTAVSATADGSDALSGIEARQVQVDGGAWQSSPATLTSDGSHTVAFRTVDAAGNIASGGLQAVPIDSTPPEVIQTLAGTAGAGGWYLSAVEVSSSAVDPTSGVSGLQMQVDGGDWAAASSVTVGEGLHVVRSRAVDNAGNTRTIEAAVQVDLSDPTLSPSVSNPGEAGWYRGGATALAGGADALSGVASEEVRLDGVWQASPCAIGGDGSHSLEFRVRDNAGREVTGGARTIRVDGSPPESSFVRPEAGSTTTTGGTLAIRGTSADALSGLAEAQISLDGGTSWRGLSVSDGAWTYEWNTRAVPNGTYEVMVRAADQAGNVGSAGSITVNVRNVAPTPTATQTVRPPTATPTASPTPTETPNALIGFVGRVLGAPTRPPAIALAQARRAADQTEPAQTVTGGRVVGLLPLGAAASMAILAGLATILDRRPRAWRRLGEIRQIRELSQNIRELLEGNPWT